MKALVGIPAPIEWRVSNEMRTREDVNSIDTNNEPLRKDRITPKAATSIDNTFCGRGLLLKVTIVFAIPMNAVPNVQMKETFLIIQSALANLSHTAYS